MYWIIFYFWFHTSLTSCKSTPFRYLKEEEMAVKKDWKEQKKLSSKLVSIPFESW